MGFEIADTNLVAAILTYMIAHIIVLKTQLTKRTISRESL